MLKRLAAHRKATPCHIALSFKLSQMGSIDKERNPTVNAG